MSYTFIKSKNKDESHIFKTPPPFPLLLPGLKIEAKFPIFFPFYPFP